LTSDERVKVPIVNGTVQLVPSVPEAFADLVAGDLSGAPSRYRLFLSGGGTAVDCYRSLAARSGLPWEGVDIYLGDERCVPPDDPDSNHRMIVETLLDVVGPVRSDNPMYTSGPPTKAAADYQKLVAAIVPDLVHLGLGPDGHTASLFPGSVALDDTDPSHLVVANTDPNAVNAHERITLTYAGIARARRTVVTVAGASKRDALARLLAGEDLPASRLTGVGILWLVDADALGDAPLPRT
jgi:6-phosphogluconolactonase